MSSGKVAVESIVTMEKSLIKHSGAPDSEDYEGALIGFEQDFEYKGAQFGPPFFKAIVEKCEKFTFHPSDIVLAGFPKTGVTWVEEIIWLICNNADVESSKRTHLMERFPLMELKYGDTPAFVELLENRPPPRFINTHLPYNFVKEGLKVAKPKTVLLMRNPKDQLVSHWHFYNKYPGRLVEKWSDFFKLFTQGKILFGDYIKHSREWFKQIDKPNVFFITYENIKADHRGSIEKMAKFLEKDLTNEQIDTILGATSLSRMRENVKKGATVAESEVKPAEGEDSQLASDSFFRKGIVGDWKSVFSEAQSRVVDDMCREHLQPLGLQFEWE